MLEVIALALALIAGAAVGIGLGAALFHVADMIDGGGE